MHTTILALGSRGDVQPLATLGKALRAAGHQVRLISFENFAGLAAAHDLDFHPIRGDAEAILRGDAGQALAASGSSVLRNLTNALRSFGALAGRIAEDLSDPRLGKTDLILNQLPGCLYSRDLAEKYSVPLITGAVIPITRTRHRPLMPFPTWLSPLPGYNALTYRVAEQGLWQWYRRPINRWRRGTLGLPPLPLGGDFGRLAREVPVINGFSRHVVERPPDWGAHVHITGYWFGQDRTWQPPDDLARFLDAGPAPVFIGFGSMPIRQPEQTTELILDALRQSGQRTILHTGWAGLGRVELPGYVFEIDYTPYDWLFPRVAAVIHHGGSGTTAAGLRAGAPTLVVPFLFDQFYWGERVTALGVGAAPIPFKQLSADRLAEAITTLTQDESVRRRAAVLGEKIQVEDGVGAAVGLIERYGD